MSFDAKVYVQQYIGFVDPSPLPGNPGWLLRNLLTFLIRKTPSNRSFRILCWRDVETNSSSTWKSVIGTVTLPSPIELPGQGRWSIVGWEKDTRGKLAPRLADLGSMMDPAR
jgi:ubiquitin-like modifier-activating enzyme ATG7